MTWGGGALGRPLVIAHRGASADAPENTLAAFELARAQGADAIELDVMRCASGELVVFHDDHLGRLGGGGTNDQVRRMSWSELRERDILGERIPTLDQVFDAVGPLLVNVELKSAPTFSERARDDGLAAALAGLIERRGLLAQVLVSSFDPLLLGRFRAHAPAVPTGLLFAHDQSLPLRRAWARSLLRPTALHPESLLVDALALRAWHEAGLWVNVWTVDDPAEVGCLAALGVDGVITNRPASTRSVLEYRQS